MKITLERFIRKYLICEIYSILKAHPFLAMSLMSLGVEFLGKCLNYNSVDDIKNKGDHESKKNFNYTIKNLNAFKEYQNLIQPDNDSKGIELYNNLRCGFAHNFMVKDEIILQASKNNFNTKPITIGVSNFFDDFFEACMEVIKLKSELMKEEFSYEENGYTGTTKYNQSIIK